MTSVHFMEGEDVEEGQVLVRLDQPAARSGAAAGARRRSARDQAQAANARVAGDALPGSGAARHRDASEQVDQMRRPTRRRSRRHVGADRAAVENAKVQLDYATITAPFAGRTGLLQVHPGNLVRANDTAPIVTINRITPVYVSFAVPEALLTDFKRYMATGQRSTSSAVAPNDEAAAVDGPHQLHRQRRRSNHRHHQGQGHVPEHRPRASGPASSST